jgi:hypothetical protein
MSDHESTDSGTSTASIEYQDNSDYDIDDDDLEEKFAYDEEDEASKELKHIQKLVLLPNTSQKYDNWSTTPSNFRDLFKPMEEPVQPNFPDKEMLCFEYFMPDYLIAKLL